VPGAVALSQAEGSWGVADVRGQRGDHVLGVSVHAAQGVGGERPLELQADVDQARVGSRDPAGVPRHAAVVEGAQGAEVVQVRTVAGGEQDRVDLLRCSVRPDDLVTVERGEHGAAVQLPGRHGVLVLAGVQDGAAAEVVPQPFRREQVEAGGLQPVVQIVAVTALRHEGDRVAGGQGDRGHLGQLVADLDRGVARADHDDPLAGVAVGAPVAGHVLQPPGEPVLAGQGRQVGVTERAGGGHDTGRVPGLPGGRMHQEARLVVRLDRGHRRADADVGAETVRVPAQVGDDLVAVRVAAWVAGEVQAGQAAVTGRGEQRQAVVVVRPRSGRFWSRLQHHREDATIHETRASLLAACREFCFIGDRL
jgi:hypothetical protein